MQVFSCFIPVAVVEHVERLFSCTQEVRQLDPCCCSGVGIVPKLRPTVSHPRVLENEAEALMNFARRYVATLRHRLESSLLSVSRYSHVFFLSQAEAPKQQAKKTISDGGSPSGRCPVAV